MQPGYGWSSVIALAFFMLLGQQIVVAASASVPASASSGLQEGTLAPDFVLPDADSIMCRFSSRKPSETVLFFFCGCRWCREAATAWEAVLKHRDLRQGALSIRSGTLVVFSGNLAEEQEFVAATGLALTKSSVLLDPESRVAVTLYRAEPCPRVYVIGSNRSIVYTNDHVDDAPRRSSVSTMIARVVQNLQSCSGRQKELSPSGLHGPN